MIKPQKKHEANPQKKGIKIMSKLSEIIVYVTERENKENKNRFLAYHTFLKNGKKIDVKFTKAVANRPTTNSRLLVDVEHYNIDKNRQFPVLWIKQITKSELYVAPKKAVEEDLFETYNPEDLPF